MSKPRSNSPGLPNINRGDPITQGIFEVYL